MSVSLFTVACGYIGARALPEILLDRQWTERLNDIQVWPSEFVRTNLFFGDLCHSWYGLEHLLAAHVRSSQPAGTGYCLKCIACRCGNALFTLVDFGSSHNPYTWSKCAALHIHTHTMSLTVVSCLVPEAEALTADSQQRGAAAHNRVVYAVARMCREA